jgi:hypothetical protein
MFLTAIVLAGSILAATSPAGEGVVEGVVVRAAGQMPVSGAEVVLRAKIDGQLVPVAETTTDARGRFRFEHLADDGRCVYLPGANHDGIHYPGPSVRLSSPRQRVEVKLAVYDAVAFPNPLVVRRHTITLRPRPGVLEVTESMLIDNPAAACYVGRTAAEGAEPVTLRLAIPADFERVTFAGEFFGRRFALAGGQLVTGIPWQPGQRELTFTYVLPAAQRQGVWERCLDLPSSGVRVSVHLDGPQRQVTCNLNRASRQEDGEIAFESGEKILSAGHRLRVELGNMPVSMMAHAPWGALAVLVGLIFVTSLPLIPRGKRTKTKNGTGPMAA